MALNKHNLQIHPLRKKLPFYYKNKEIKEYFFCIMALHGLLFWIWILTEIALALLGKVSIFN